jgi:hypothetical protein
MRHDPGLAASPPVLYILEVERSGYSPFRLSSALDGQPPRDAAACRVRRLWGSINTSNSSKSPCATLPGSHSRDAVERCFDCTYGVKRTTMYLPEDLKRTLARAAVEEGVGT